MDVDDVRARDQLSHRLDDIARSAKPRLLIR
jgi:hypothetical protein